MKFKIESLDDLSESRQVMETEPHKFTSIFVCILLAVIISFILWACFSEKEVVVNVTGMVKPSGQSYVVSNPIAEEVKEVYMKNGQTIKKDEVLYKTDDTPLKTQKSKVEGQKKVLANDINNLGKLKKSIADNTNYFKESKEEKEYYYKYESYFIGNKVSVEDKTNLINSKNDSVNQINHLEKLIKSIEDNKNYNAKGSIYNEQFNNYQISRKSIDGKMQQLLISKKVLQNKIGSGDAIAQIDAEIQDNKNGLIKLESEIKLEARKSINELRGQLKTTNSNLIKFDEGVNLSKEKNKITLLAQIEEKLNSSEEKLKEVDVSLKEINENIEKCKVKSTIDGKLDIKANLQPGIIIQTGAIVANVLPKSNAYKVELIIPDKDIANIKDGQEIKYSFTSLPYNEYGFLKGSMESISVNSQTDSEKGIVFYKGEGILKNNILYSHKNEEAVIKPGMTCEARIITRREKMLYYLLEKLNLKD
ncbi:HlyD family efflux transporter periplasmic adaptor subunit [Clostridium estertheticum]|uniref:HlyD family efflux transporter periplasmic adaptor subunit n=1 Tax=Clostridium estertheticum TaxID=238834 RepID=UPI002714CF49|nr:HlyD family efflux transporter periplasmic adaptor subunit [Clostridium estertheticum]WLC69541.1 HlyD family efflux transporter periplasmic adaptor subunit [Clostridium estertheticum]